MQRVSDNWKNAHKQTLLNESFVEVSLDIADPDALADASPQDNGAIYISNSTQLTDGIETQPIPYCTLEQNLWCLNGTRKALPDSIWDESGHIRVDNNGYGGLLGVKHARVITQHITHITVLTKPICLDGFSTTI